MDVMAKISACATTFATEVPSWSPVDFFRICPARNPAQPTRFKPLHVWLRCVNDHLDVAFRLALGSVVFPHQKVESVSKGEGAGLYFNALEKVWFPFRVVEVVGFPVSQEPLRKRQFPYQPGYGVDGRRNGPVNTNFGHRCLSRRQHFSRDFNVHIWQCGSSLFLKENSGALKQDDAVRIRALGSVGDTPAIRRFREFLIIDHDANAFKRKTFSGAPY